MSRFSPIKNPSSFRKLAAAMWKAPNDPHIFGSVDIDMTAALSFLTDYNVKHQCKATITHLVVRALALVLARYPEANAKVGFGKIQLRDSVDLFCQVATDGGRDLSGFKLDRANERSLANITSSLSSAAQDIRANRDPAFNRSRSLFKALPLWGLRLILGTMDLLTNTLGLHLPKLGMPHDPFGSAMVTSVGMMGIDTGFAPFPPIARCSAIFTVTKIKERAVVVEGKVVARPILRLCAAFDHRIIDGFLAGKMSTEIEELLTNPTNLLTEGEQ